MELDTLVNTANFEVGDIVYLFMSNTTILR